MSAFEELPLDSIANIYILDPNNDVEMVRLLAQHRFVTQLTGGLLPEPQNLANVHNILDIACGTGGWVLDMAKAHPEIQVVGVDTSTRMINYAHAQKLLEHIHNAHFAFMNVLKPLDFPDNAFDIINVVSSFSFMPLAMWRICYKSVCDACDQVAFSVLQKQNLASVTATPTNSSISSARKHYNLPVKASHLMGGK